MRLRSLAVVWIGGDDVTSTRRGFLRDTLAASAALGLGVAGTAGAAGRRVRRPSVAILGGGIAGLTAAHELAERGFDVAIYERKALGGKARSIDVPASARDGRRPLPGEHGYRICIGTYQYLPDTMRRIPLRGTSRSVYDNLVQSADFLVARSGGREDFHTLLTGPPTSLRLDSIGPQLTGLLELTTGLPPEDVTVFMRQLLIYLTSSEERRFGQWEKLSMWDYMKADGRSPDYQHLLTDYLSHVIQSTPAKLASARAHMNLWEAVVYSASGHGNDGRSFAELLKAPTNEAWIDPWVAHLQGLGVRFNLGCSVEALAMRRGRVSYARVRDRHGRRRLVDADWFVCAVPVERARRLLDRHILAADPQLEGVRHIQTKWMNGIQFYLREEVPINAGHVAYIDTPWVVSSVSQAQFWPDRDLPRDYGDGQVRDCLSVIASEWEQPGIMFGKAARDCTPDEIAREVWAQIKAALEDTGRQVLRDDVLHSWFLDPAIRHRKSPAGTRSDEPLFIATPGLWDKRPTAATKIPNLFLASDYVRNRSAIDAATMDGANAAAREAVNALLDAAGSRASDVPLYERYTAPEFTAAKQLDADRFRRGQPHALER